MMNTAINLLSVIPMRKEPSHRSEMVSQLLFGEYAEILEEEEQFVRVKCLYDSYEGWIQTNQISLVSEVFSADTYTIDWVTPVSLAGHHVHAPMGSPVYGKENVFHVNKTEVRYLPSGLENYWNGREKTFAKTDFRKICESYSNTPYLWGGKSVFGIDCSGFVQQVFKLFGVKLLRDAYLQAEQGSVVESVAETKFGDLAFFRNEKGRVTHVGIILEDRQIIHASGKVRVDTIDERGIVNKETGEWTHHLHSMRRYF